jgi:hypothetical protein
VTPVGGGLWPNPSFSNPCQVAFYHPPPFLNPSIWPSTVCDVLLCGYGIRAGQEAYGGGGEAG